MPQFLLSLHSKIDSLGALGVFDTELGLRYLQIDSLDSRVRDNQIRGIGVYGNTLYAVTTASLRLYNIKRSGEYPVFELKREVILAEWLAGDSFQADLLPLFISEKREKIYIGCNHLSSIDEFDLEGNFISRKHLSEVPGSVFTYKKNKKYPYGHIRYLTESPEGYLMVTVAFRSGNSKGSVVNVETGEIFIGGLVSPHGGFFSGNSFYLLSVSKGIAYSYTCGQEQVQGLKWKSKAITGKRDKLNNLRGLILSENRVYSSILNFEKSHDRWVSPQIVGFDIHSGEQSYLKFLPDLEDFRHPRVFSMIHLSEYIHDDGEKDISIFKFDKEIISPVVYEKNDQHLSVQQPMVASNGTEKIPVIVAAEVNLFYLRGAYFGFGARRQLRKRREFKAIDNLSFTIYEGEVVGLIGRNGSGKSTLGMMIAGSMRPDSGSLRVDGRAQLLSLGVGFKGELSGRDNMFMNGTLLGLTREQIVEHMDDMVSFAELGDFIDEPVRTYSAGMKSRLAFAVATAVEPDILILDEVLSTGDQSFRNKAENRMKSMRGKAKTVVMVSHNTGQLKKLCSRIIWLERGKLMMDGDPKIILGEYNKFSQSPEEWLETNLAQINR